MFKIFTDVLVFPICNFHINYFIACFFNLKINVIFNSNKKIYAYFENFLHFKKMQ